MNAIIQQAGNAMRAPSLDLAAQIRTSEEPGSYARGALSMLMGCLAGALGHEAVALLLAEQLQLLELHAQLRAPAAGKGH